MAAGWNDLSLAIIAAETSGRRRIGSRRQGLNRVKAPWERARQRERVSLTYVVRVCRYCLSNGKIIMERSEDVERESRFLRKSASAPFLDGEYFSRRHGRPGIVVLCASPSRVLWLPRDKETLLREWRLWIRMSIEAFVPHPPHVFLPRRKLAPQDDHLPRIETLTVLDKGESHAVDWDLIPIGR